MCCMMSSLITKSWRLKQTIKKCHKLPEEVYVMVSPSVTVWRTNLSPRGWSQTRTYTQSSAHAACQIGINLAKHTFWFLLSPIWYCVEVRAKVGSSWYLWYRKWKAASVMYQQYRIVIYTNKGMLTTGTRSLQEGKRYDPKLEESAW